MHRRILNEIQHVVRSPESDLSQVQQRFRYVYELVSHCRGELTRIRAEGMAAELTYRTIFSLIPVLVLALVMFRVVGGLQDVQEKVENQLYSFFGVPDIPEAYSNAIERELEAEADQPLLSSTYRPLSQQLDELGGTVRDKQPPAAADPLNQIESAELVKAAERERDRQETTEQKQEVRASIRNALQQATEKVANLNFTSIGIVGLALFVYTAVTLANAVEHLFNIVYEAPSERPVHIRLAIHWSIITLGGGLLMMSLYMSSQLVDYLGGMVTNDVISRFITHGLSLLASWVLLFLVYALMPNTQVSIRAAAVGSFISALLWEIAKFAFQIYVAKAVPYSALYGSLGLIPLFLFWIYVTWILVLFGLTLTKTLQTLHGRDPRRLRVATDNLPNTDPNWMIPIMIEIARAFATGHAVDQQELVERLQIPGTMVHPMLQRLEQAGVVYRIVATAGRDEQVSLAKPAESIRLVDILQVAHYRPEGMHDSRWKVLDDLNQIQLKTVGDRTLADCVGSASPALSV